jgi:hypothetical protein
MNAILTGKTVKSPPTIEDSVTSTSTTNAGSANAVKKAYDLAGTKVSKSGDTMTGQLTATKIKMTSVADLGSTPTKVAVVDSSGVICTRSMDDFMDKDLGDEYVKVETGEITLSSSSVSLPISSKSTTVTVTYNGLSPTYTVTTSNSSIATATISGSTVTITGTNTSGSATITVSAAAT